MEPSKIVQHIQFILAPAVMISSSALLLLGFQNKFSALFNRFRALNEERRHLRKKTKDTIETERLENVEKQLNGLTFRAACVKNAILATYVGIISFLATSFFIFFGIYLSTDYEFLTIFSFGTGLTFVFLASILIMIEVSVAYRILRLERKS